MQPIESDVRRVIAAERIERLRRAAEPHPGRPRSPRTRFGNLLIAAGTRLSREAPARPAATVSRPAA